MTAPLDEARLRELAEAATPGPWEWHKARTLRHLQTSGVDGRGSFAQCEMSAHARYDEEAAFIAAANPATILALLDALSTERERGDRAVGLLRRIVEIEDGSGMGVIGWSDAIDASSAFLATQKAEGAET